MMGYKIIDFSANFICKALFFFLTQHHEIDFDSLVVPTLSKHANIRQDLSPSEFVKSMHFLLIHQFDIHIRNMHVFLLRVGN